MLRKTILLILVVLAVMGCRSRRTAVPPKTMPPVETTTTTQPPVVSVEEPERDFPPVSPTKDDDVLSDDIREADRVAHERGWIRDAFFPFDASTLDDDAQSALQQSATWLRSHPEYRIRIEGHCDARGTEQYNLALGDRRANTASSYLLTLGVERNRIETVSLGEERPFAEGEDEAAWAQNRRAHLVLAGRR